MKSNKIYIILITIIIIFFVVMFLVFGLDELRKEEYDSTIIVGNDTVWTYKNKSWSNNTSYNSINWKKYDVYLNNEKNGNYYLWYSDKWYAFDNKKEAVLLDGDLLAIKSNYDISVYDFQDSDIDDYSYVYKMLEKNKISTNSLYTVNKKIELDFDNDENEETFYIISNAFPMDFNPSKIFSIVFMVKNDKIYPIYTNISENKGFNGCRPYFSGFIDVDNNSDYEFVLSCSQYSVKGISRMLYDFDGDKFKILISNNK